MPNAVKHWYVKVEYYQKDYTFEYSTLIQVISPVSKAQHQKWGSLASPSDTFWYMVDYHRHGAKSTLNFSESRINSQW